MELVSPMALDLFLWAQSRNTNLVKQMQYLKSRMPLSIDEAEKYGYY
jgi:hypothetical protein